MPLDHLELLGWMAARERRLSEGIAGAALLNEAGHLARGETNPWEMIARGVELLDGMDCLIFRLAPGEAPRGARDIISPTDLQRIEEIRVSFGGHSLCMQSRARDSVAARPAAFEQTGSGGARRGDVRVLVALAREQLEQLEAPEQIREEARAVLERLQESADGVGSPEASALAMRALRDAAVPL
jgi:hypothetical protein